MSRVQSTALILRVKPYGESDLLVDLLTEQIGRTSVLARGALRTKKRYMGVLEPGTLVKIDYVKKTGLSTLGPCDVLSSVWKARQNLDLLANLYYVLEILRLATPTEEQDLTLFSAACHLIELFESEDSISIETMIAWELHCMKHLGYALRIHRCPYTQLPPDGLSLKAGGAISSQANRPYWPVSTPALRILYQLQRGDLHCLFDHQDHAALRSAFGGLWGDIIGQSLKSLSFFQKITHSHLSSLD